MLEIDLCKNWNKKESLIRKAHLRYIAVVENMRAALIKAAKL